MSPPDELLFSHVTIRVADLARSEAFYAALGFERLYAGTPEDAFRRLLQAPEDAALSMVAMQQGAARIELLAISPAAGPAEGTPPLGLRHLAVRVPDLDRAAARIVEAGGAVESETRVRASAGAFMMARDPDGVRLLLMQLESAPTAAG
ncbi:MAG: hypothetical protein JWQ97_2184 [Phenylobacterium sp.]|nr:hypothetical protein [Phenylobacterium sp.]